MVLKTWAASCLDLEGVFIPRLQLERDEALSLAAKWKEIARNEKSHKDLLLLSLKNQGEEQSRTRWLWLGGGLGGGVVVGVIVAVLMR